MRSAVIRLGGWKSAFLIGALGLLAACEDGQGPDFLKKKPEADTGFVSAPPPVEGEERDVEAPELFSANEPALWDGRPSLGGVWVAYPGVTDPQRVIIRNTENNRSVVGALFRRERDNPGPLIQVSSDAADALGMLAGAPAKLSVIALRKEAIPQAVAAPEPEADATDEDAAVEETALPAATEIEATAIDPVAAVAGAAIENASTPGSEVPETEVAAAPAPAPAAQRPSLLAMTKPFVQVGIFSQQSNADAAVQTLRDGGVLPEVKETTNSENTTIYRVVAGPASTRADRRALINKIKELGFVDAYAVTD